MTPANTNEVSTATRPLSYRRLTVCALGAAVGAVILNTLLFFLGRNFGAFSPTLRVQGEPFELLPVVLSSFAPVLVGAALFALLPRFVAQPKRIFGIVALIVLTLMFFTPFTIPNAPTSTIVLLELMHLIVAAGTVWAVRRA